MRYKRNCELTKTQRIRRNYLAMLRKRKYRKFSIGKITDKNWKNKNRKSINEKEWKRLKAKGKDKIKMNKYRSNPNNKYKNKMRTNTLRRHGKLEKGYEYHHWTPYSRDNYTILEKDFHKWYHTHPKECNLKGRI